MALVDELLGKRVYLDANIFIYALENLLPYAKALMPVFAEFERGRIIPVTSALSMSEVLVKPFQEDRLDKVQEFRDFFCRSEKLLLADISLDILESASRMRALHGVRLPDAIHLATAQAEGCACFLSNDKRLMPAAGTGCVLLDDYLTES